MIERYSYLEMSNIFSLRATLSRWLEVELAVVEALSQVGLIDPKETQVLRTNAPTINDDFVFKVNEREKITNHDLAAFVDILQSSYNTEAARWIHFGLTSSDVIDCSVGMALKEASRILEMALIDFIEVLKEKSRKYEDTPMAGRTHGMHAEPTTFGAKIALFGLQAARDLKRLRDASAQVSVGKLSGAVGTYSNIDPDVESLACERLGILPVPATQVVSRDRHAEYLFALASIGNTIESVSTEIRHLARTELGEAQEYFAAGQKGSSAMPHKRNPILSERLCGLSRVMRGYLSAGMEDVALWHERDISHSSVERIVLADASILVHYMLKKVTSLVETLVVNTDRMRENLEISKGMVFSQSVLLTLVKKGLERDVAYRLVQSAAMEIGSRSFKDALKGSEEICKVLSEEEIEEAFDLKRVLKNSKLVVNKLEGEKY